MQSIVVLSSPSHFFIVALLETNRSKKETQFLIYCPLGH